MQHASKQPDTSEQADQLFHNEDIRRCSHGSCYGDFYAAGIWIGGFKDAWNCARFSLIPVVKAEKLPPKPERPPPMKYTDLPLYSTPHCEYKNYVEDSKKCPNADVKLMHTYLYPKIRYYRRNLHESICGLQCDLAEMKDDICDAYCQKKNEFICYMRHPDNITLRQSVLALSTLTGFYISRGRNLPKRVLYTSLGALAAGALCFPRRTDEVFRTAIHHIGKGAMAICSLICSKNFSLRERLPCQEELPPPASAKSKKGYHCPNMK